MFKVGDIVEAIKGGISNKDDREYCAINVGRLYKVIELDGNTRINFVPLEGSGWNGWANDCFKLANHRKHHLPEWW